MVVCQRLFRRPVVAIAVGDWLSQQHHWATGATSGCTICAPLDLHRLLLWVVDTHQPARSCGCGGRCGRLVDCFVRFAYCGVFRRQHAGGSQRLLSCLLPCPPPPRLPVYGGGPVTGGCPTPPSCAARCCRRPAQLMSLCCCPAGCGATATGMGTWCTRQRCCRNCGMETGSCFHLQGRTPSVLPATMVVSASPNRSRCLCTALRPCGNVGRTTCR
jgi:hypothetical protein